jgi:uncharacterized membrane protein
LSIFSCTFFTATLSLAVTSTFTFPESVAFAAGEVIETVGEVVSPLVANVISPLVAVLLLPSVERTLKWYSVPMVKFERATWWLVTIAVLTGVLDP